MNTENYLSNIAEACKKITDSATETTNALKEIDERFEKRDRCIRLADEILAQFLEQ